MLITHKQIIILLLAFFVCKISNASYVTVNSGSSSYSNSTYIGSVPYTGSGFSYSDSNGNSISTREIHSFPVIVNQYRGAVWVWMNNGGIPGNAIVFQYVNGYPVFFCRVQNNGALFYGNLVPNQGCYVPDISAKPFNAYQVLVR